MNSPLPVAALLASPKSCLPVLGLLCVSCVHAAEPVPTVPEPTAPERAKLVLELKYEGNLADTSGAKRTCTAHGTVAFVPGRHGQGAAFDGRTWIDSGFPQAELGDEFTVECWVNPAPQQHPYADIFGNHVGEALGFVLQQEGGSTNQFLAAYGAGAGRWVLTPAVALAPNRWQHVALVKTRDSLRLFLNGVLAAEEQDPAPARPSKMPVAVGLGYTAPERCFQGLIDDFRIWNQALSAFEHAGIDPAAAREVRAQGLDAAPRPVAGELAKSWTLATEDTRLTLGLTTAGELVLREVSCPAAGWNWFAQPLTCRLPAECTVAGQQRPLKWQALDPLVDETDGRKLTWRWACAEPALELASEWCVRPGPGPVQHVLRMRNCGTQAVTIGEHPTFDLDLAGAANLWTFHSDGGTPDSVGVYRRPITAEQAGRRHTVRTVPTGEFLPYVVLASAEPHGLYLGLEWSTCRIETLTLAGGSAPTVRLRAGNIADLRAELAPGQTLAFRPGFIGTYRGDLDDAGNRLRRWRMRYAIPDVLRQDPSYPKVQWNAFGATGKAPGSWEPVEQKFYPLLDDIAPLGFEEVMIDVGWWQGAEPDSHQVTWPSGMRRAADYAHQKGLRFGLYWTDNLDMADPAARQQRANRIRRLYREYAVDLWRSDSTRGEVLAATFAATRGFYELVDQLTREIPGFQWENCSGGGRIKDFGAMRRAVKIFNSDTYSTLHVRQGFYDSSYVLPSIQLEGHVGSVDGRFRPQGVTGLRYAFRSASLGAPEWFLDAPNGGNGTPPWTAEEKDAVRACVATYKAELRPLIRQADLYHILPRPDGQHRDGLEYYDPAAGKGVVYLFQPAAEPTAKPLRFKGLAAQQSYRLRFADGSHPPCVKSGAELMDPGLTVTLPGAEVSELIFFELVR